MQDFFHLMVKSARYLGDIAFRLSTIMKRIFLVFMMTFSLSGAIEWENEATASAVCDNSTMHLHVNFTKVFQGSVHQSGAIYNPQCIYTVPINMNVTEVDLSLPFGSCDIQTAEVDNIIMASIEVTIQMHNLLDSIYDRTVKVSCEIDNFHPVNETVSNNPFSGDGLEHSWIEFKNGLVLLGEVGEPIESTLFFVVNMRDRGLNKDMLVQNCILHTDGNVTNTTTLLQLSNFYGCPDPSAILPNFTVVRPENDQISMFAYAPISNFSLTVSGGRISVSCGVTICEYACPTHCNDTESPIRLPLSEYVTKDVVTRSDGVVISESLIELNRHDDKYRRTLNRPKRSIGSFFSRIFRWESITRSVTDGNVTNVTSTKMVNGLVVNNKILAKDVQKSANKFVDANLNDTVSTFDGFGVDWQTFRLIAVMTVALFITVVSCYCCGLCETKKAMRSQAAFVS